MKPAQLPNPEEQIIEELSGMLAGGNKVRLILA
ncbi:hypothetical protein CGMCC3_g15298 [Colletotrichum fructicola]|nr:uncharacterized protein CGMCC3_g15298 [Colletotrichum fructicola]KAE9568571.1 hypothetical protein CGMCC3_g15298 [Colletotrichum fructicola]